MEESADIHVFVTIKLHIDFIQNLNVNKNPLKVPILSLWRPGMVKPIRSNQTMGIFPSVFYVIWIIYLSLTLTLYEESSPSAVSVNILIILVNFAVTYALRIICLGRRIFHVETVQCKWHHDFGKVKNATADFYSFCSKVAAQCERAALWSCSCLLVSREGQQRAFSEATVSSLMTRVKVGVQERVNSHTDLGVSQVAPQGSFKDFQEPIQRDQRNEPELRRNLSLLVRWRKGWVWD